MKGILFLTLTLLTISYSSAQKLIGAWEAETASDSGAIYRNVLIISDGYQVLTTYEENTGKFIHTNGGTWSLNGDMMTETIEFHTDDSSMVGRTVNFKIKIKENTLQIEGSGMPFKRIDDGRPGALQGAWLMSGRIRNGETQTRDTNRPRKTMKILSGTRFQWIAYNTATKQFMGSGGGTYTTVDGTYTENIEFFSRDDSKAGLSLSFNYELINGSWHHSGLSSKGAPIHEIWSRRKL
jgi:hypothetical protein